MGDRIIFTRSPFLYTLKVVFLFMLLPRKILKQYLNHIHQEKIIDFLLHIKTKGLAEFRKFVQSQGIEIPRARTVLFHGSPRRHEVLAPSISDGEPNEDRNIPLVYATDHPEYAIFHAILHLDKGGSASAVLKNKKPELRVSLGFVNGPSELKGGYLYILDGILFKKGDNREFACTTPVTPIFIVEVEPSDLTTPIGIDVKRA